MDLTKKQFTLTKFTEEEETAAQDLDLYLDNVLDSVNSKVDKDRTFPGLSPPAADDEFPIVHSLGFVPSRYLLVSADKAGQLYRSARQWTTETAYFKHSTASVAVEVILW